MERLRQYIIEHPFSHQADEIYFFREVKPRFQARLVYYLRLFHLEARRPPGGRAVQRKYWENELHNLENTWRQHQALYQYVRSGATYLDKQYFVRGREDIRLLSEPQTLCFDTAFHTSHDYQVAELQAMELLEQYIGQELTKLDTQTGPPLPTASRPRRQLRLTAPKAAITEVIYGLYLTRAFENGEAAIAEIQAVFEEVLGIKLGNSYQGLQEMRYRKKSPTYHLDNMVRAIVAHMEQLDDR